MRSRVVVLLVLLLAPALTRAQDPRVTKLREYLVAAASLGHVNGSVLVAERGQVLVDTAFGFANMELGVRNSVDTRFRVASITKQFTAMAIVMLAQDGKLSLSDPIAKHLDSLPASWNGITIHHLLRHTSGISDYEEWFDGYTTQAYSDYMSQAGAPARIVRDAKAKPLDHEPGTKFHYSNSAYILLGYIVEKASGMPYDEFLRRRIHEPLGMAVSDQDRSERLIPGRAQGYRLREGAQPVAFYGGLARTDFRNAVYQKMEPPQADAGLITTARDLYKWDQALYTERLVRKPLLDSMFAPGIGNYGYGWFIGSGANGVTHEHSGGLPGFAAYIMRMPETQRTIIVLGNVEFLGRTVRDLASILRGAPVAIPRPRRIVANDTVAQARFAGWYHSARGDSVRVGRDGSMLIAQWPGRFTAGLLPESSHLYYAPFYAGEARFTERDGAVTMLLVTGVGDTLITATKRPAR